MKLTDYHTVAPLVSARARLVKQLAQLDDVGLSVSLNSLSHGIGASYGDEAMDKAIRPVVRQQLEQRLKANARALKKLGVEVDGEPEAPKLDVFADLALSKDWMSFHPRRQGRSVLAEMLRATG